MMERYSILLNNPIPAWIEYRCDYFFDATEVKNYGNRGANTSSTPEVLEG